MRSAASRRGDDRAAFEAAPLAPSEKASDVRLRLSDGRIIEPSLLSPADQYPDREHDAAAEHDLECRLQEWRVHVCAREY